MCEEGGVEGIDHRFPIGDPGGWVWAVRGVKVPAHRHLLTLQDLIYSLNLLMAPIIFHVDMDSFFASIEIRDHPEMAGKPVIVGADPEGGRGRGVVSTCSYEARVYGIHSGMPISQAYRLCPHATFLQVDIRRYRAVSQRIMDILRSFTDRMEEMSIDEAYLDMSHLGDYGRVEREAMRIKQRIREAEHLTCSIGVGPSRVVAKIASGWKKPDGLTVVPPASVQSFLNPLPVTAIPGIGRKTAAELERMGIRTVAELARCDIQTLRSAFGKTGIYMHMLSRGKDIRGIRTAPERKSIGKEVTFSEDTGDSATLTATMGRLVDAVHRRLTDEGVLFRTVTVTARYTDFITRSRSRTLPFATGDRAILEECAVDLLSGFITGRKIRLIGVRVSRLESASSRQTLLDEFFGTGIRPGRMG
ncbi:MAG: DNA polymerase IV [Methanoculleaceae archaeon]